MLLLRVENRESHAGLWYHGETQSQSNVVHQLELSGRVLPMDFDAEIAAGRWRSAAESLTQLRYWFTFEDLQKLIPLGYKLYQVAVPDARIHSTEWYTHHLYQDSHVQDRQILDIGLLLPC